MSLDSVANLERRLDERLKEARDLALAGSSGEDPAWDAYLGSLGLEPLAPSRREEILNSGMDHAKGVLPSEFRLALLSLVEFGHVERRRLAKEEADTTQADAAAREALGKRLETFVADEMKRYLKDVRPPVSPMSIFANAMKTTVKHEAVADAVNTLKCPTCSAARLKEMGLGRCGYCGHDFQLLEG